MSFSKLVLLYLGTAVVFFAVDFAWLSFATSRFYRPYIGDLLLERPNIPVAAGFYLLYVVGIIALAVIPGLQQGSIWEAVWRAALFGFLAYATYDLTNLSTLKGWAWQVSAIDMVWGAVLNSIVAFASYYIGKFLGLP